MWISLRPMNKKYFFLFPSLWAIYWQGASTREGEKWGGILESLFCSNCLLSMTLTSPIKSFGRDWSTSNVSLDWCDFLGWMSSHKAKGYQFDSLSGHMPGLQVWMKPIDVALLLFPPLFSSLQKNRQASKVKLLWDIGCHWKIELLQVETT